MSNPTAERRQTPKILAIIVNWNKRDYLQNLLRSLRELGGTPFDIVVVDNASTDGSPEMVKSEFPECELVETGENLGGTGGFNAGMTYGLRSEKDYDFFWLLDNDVIVHKGALDGLLAPMLEDEKIGIVGSTILVLDDETEVQEIGGRMNWKTVGLDKNAEGFLEDIPRPHLYESDYVAACSLLARVSAVRKVGIWDPVYFVTWDDVEWGVRFKRAGYRVVATTESLIRHESFDNRRAKSGPAVKYLCERNCLYFAWRFAPPKKLRGLFFYHMRLALSAAENLEADGRPAEAKALRLAIKDFLDGRMGKPPQVLFEKSAPAPPPPPMTSAQKRAIKRIGLMMFDNPEVTRTIGRKLQQEFPRARIDVLLFADKESLLRERLPNRRLFSVRTFPQRARVAWIAATQYDALAAPSFFHGFLFEEFAPYSLRFADDLTWTAEKRDLTKVVGLAFRRARAVALAAWYTLRATRLRPSKVDYHFYKT
ncbi:MAG: hypothetical protein PWP23_166 [Candidatus Sumerlaeota bacterium]|nr:hypothetical protein [Candidatus Sumerlaeota bacterium]